MARAISPLSPCRTAFPYGTVASPAGMAWSLASTLAKLKPCHQMPMPGTATTNVEMTCLQGLADLERLEGPWLDGLATGSSFRAFIFLF